MDDADQGMEASAATIRDRVRGQNAVTLNHQQAIYTEKLRPSSFRVRANRGRHSNNHFAASSAFVNVRTFTHRFRATISPNLRWSICSGLPTVATFDALHAKIFALSPRKYLSTRDISAWASVKSRRSLFLFARSQCSTIDSNCLHASSIVPAPVNLTTR